MRSGKALLLKELTGEQRRQLIDTQQVFESWRSARIDEKRRFAGSVRWADRNGTKYLLRKIGRAETSLGPRSPETEEIHEAFITGREKNRDRLRGLVARLGTLAPINAAMGLGRVPSIAARILRKCDERELMGTHLVVVGTNAIFAYEVLAGVHLESGLVATGDMDLLYDARRHLSLALAEIRLEGLIGVLRSVDSSFDPIHPGGFRAANRNGYLVDLIRPEARDVFRDKLKAGLTDLPDDLQGAAIAGLGWLVNSPKIEAIAIDERGYPVRMVAIDPRAFALHKAWVSFREDREPIKAKRDFEQAKAAAVIATRYLRGLFDSPDLAALPNSLREIGPTLALAVSNDANDSTEPKW